MMPSPALLTAARPFPRLAALLALVLAAAVVAVAPAQPVAPGSAMPSTGAHANAPTQAAADDFAATVDLAPLERLAVHSGGRVLSYGSFAASTMRFISGPRWIEGNPPGFTLLDMIFRPERYADRPIIFVKKKVVRAEIARTLRRSGEEQVARMRTDTRSGLTPEREAIFRAELDRRLDSFMEFGLASPVLFGDPAVQDLLSRMSRDLLRTAKPVQAIQTALAFTDPNRLRSRLLLVAPASGDPQEPWHTMDELSGAGADTGHLAAMPAGLRADLTATWRTLGDAWGRSDAPAATAAVARLAELLPEVTDDPTIYPDAGRLSLESWYFKSRHMTWVWIFYAFALVPLTLHVVFRWAGAFWVGLGFFTIAFGLHSAAFVIRWIVADRFPNSNMFEAVTTAAWFGGLFALCIELALRRRPTRSLFAIASSAASMVALMAAYYMPLQLDPHISNRMPVLLDLWLYIHTNVIIFSYVLVFMSSVTASMYLIYRGVRWLQGAEGLGKTEFARVGGAASLIQTSGTGEAYLDRPKTTLGQVLDGTTMILVELSFVLLWTGLVMGAIWADHSWGRPWGWDPKEVFALNTFLVFAVLIHSRFRSKDRGFWTAIIAIVGCAVMLFNWIIINFTIAGLHSYA